MKVSKLDDMKQGWFVGDFLPTTFATRAAEVAVKRYVAGASEERHYHKVATEITVVLSGHVRMNGVELKSGDIITLEPNESSDFHVISDTVTVVVKVPGALNDKYPGSLSC
jgi:hypothetical protein